MNPGKDRSAINRYTKVGGILLFGFGLAAVLMRIVQFFILGDPPLEELVQTNTFFYLQGIPSLVMAVLFLIGATALYLYQAHELGWIGLIIYLIAFFALVLSSGAMWTYAFSAPDLAREAPQLLTSPYSGIIQAVIVSMALGQIGWLLLILVSFKTKLISHWALWIAILSIVLVGGLAPFAHTQLLRLIYNILLGVGPLMIGYALWKAPDIKHS